MTTTKMRRGKRSLAAILAAMLVASVLAVVAGSPAQAANTASEVLIDHDDNAKTAMVREFAGQDRYDTALRLAKNFATNKGGLGAVPAAFVASGETLVDSISIAGFAGYTDAPILLTPGNSLHGGVADFIEDYDVKTVYVLGGSAAVADSVVTAIEGQASKPTVTRIAGADRYATAAAAAGMIDAESSWCGTDAVSAVLINGSSDALPFGVAVQTTAYKLQLPVLMTAADELPDATAEFISDNDIEHVQIIGGTDTVSAGVASALTTLGVDTVARVDGDSASAVSVELAKLAGNGCGDDLAPVSTNRVVLVRGNPDGVAAAPVLASTLANGDLVTPLIVGDTLPASVHDYLAATPKVVGGERLALGIVAIGGTAAVSADVMTAAVNAAASAGTLTVQIGASMDTDNDKKPANPNDPVRPGTTFSLYFSDDVVAAPADNAAANAALLAKIRDIIEVNDAVARVESVTTETGGVCTPRRVDVTLAKALTPGDTVSIVTSTHTFGTQSDQRRIAASASATVQATPKDTLRPKVTIIGIANESTFQIRISDNVALDGEAVISEDELTFTSGKGTATLGTVTHTAGELTATVAVTRAAEAGGNAAADTLVAGDRLTIKSGALADTSENVNASTTGRAIAEQASPKITSVKLSNPLHSVQTKWEVPDAFFADDTPGTDEITIEAKVAGAAAGAAGNDWSIVFDTPSGYSAAKASDIDVRVDSKGKTVTVRFVNGPVTIGSLLAALKANSDFDALFSASTACGVVPTTALEPSTAPDDRDELATFVDADGADATDGIGRTQFAVEVGFNAYISAAVSDELLEDILARAVARNRGTATADAYLTTLRTALDIASVTDADTLVGGAPTRTVRYEMQTASVALMPRDRDRVETAAGAVLLDDNPATTDSETGFRPAVDHVALGYKEDVNTTTANSKVDESRNGKSDVRISQTASVKARNP